MTICTANHNHPIQSSKKLNHSSIKCARPKRFGKSRKSKRIAFSNLERINMNAAGIDIASKEHWVCVPPERTPENVRKYGTFTCDLYAISDWLKQCGVTTVAMESTGLYWVPLYLRLVDDGFEVFLVNARHIKNVAGRPKTDRLDCQWIQRLHTFGLLPGSFIPDRELWMLRSITRHRDKLINFCDRHIQHIQKALQQMNLLLHKVISDISGVTGMRILDAILAGQRDPITLAKLADCRIQASTEQIAKALQGEYRDELLFVLQQSLDGYRFYKNQIHSCDQQIEQLLPKWDKNIDPSRSLPIVPTKPKKPKQHQVTYDARSYFYRIFGIDLTQIPGLDESTVQTLFAEVGADMSPWETQNHFAAWPGLAPCPDISGGKVLKHKTKKVQSRVAKAFRTAALGCGKTDTALGAFYRRLKARIGGAKALTATARKLAIIFYRMVKEQVEYKELGADYYILRHEAKVKRQLARKAKLLGLKLVPIDEAQNPNSVEEDRSNQQISNL